MSSEQEEICFTVSAPGKIILLGEHSVVYGKTALAASISNHTNVTWNVNRTVSHKLKLSLSAVNLEKEFRIGDIDHSFLAIPLPILAPHKLTSFNFETPELLDLPELLPVLSKNIPDAHVLTKEQKNPLLAFFTLFVGMLSCIDIKIHSCSIRVTSDLNIGAGLGSSASYSVALAAAFLQFVRVSIHEQCQGFQKAIKEGYKAITTVGSPSAEFSDVEKDLISRWAYQCERIMHGNPSGIDNLVCTYGSIVQFKKNLKGQGVTWKKLPPVKKLDVLLVDTKVSRSTSVLVEKVAQKKTRFPTLLEAIFHVMDQVALFATVVFENMSSLNNSSGVEQELDKLEELIDVNQGQLASLGVSHPRLDRVCEVAARHGLHAKLTGAGGGGNAFVLVRPSHCDIEGLRQQLQVEGYDCLITGIGGEGVRLNNNIL